MGEIFSVLFSQLQKVFNVNFEVKVPFKWLSRGEMLLFFFFFKATCHKSVKNKLMIQVNKEEQSVFDCLTVSWQSVQPVWNDKNIQRWQRRDVKIQPCKPPSAPPPWPSDPPHVFLKDDSLFANTWALRAGTLPREGEKQTRQVSAFPSMKNKRGESWEGGMVE